MLIRTKKAKDMAKRKFTKRQILTVVKQLEAGRTAAEMAREVGVSTYTIYSWKASTAGSSRTRRHECITWKTKTID
jgi:hypothetical protein